MKTTIAVISTAFALVLVPAAVADRGHDGPGRDDAAVAQTQPAQQEPQAPVEPAAAAEPQAQPELQPAQRAGTHRHHRVHAHA